MDPDPYSSKFVDPDDTINPDPHSIDFDIEIQNYSFAWVWRIRGTAFLIVQGKQDTIGWIPSMFMLGVHTVKKTIFDHYY